MNRKERLEALLTSELDPLFISVADESNQHHVPENAQTHFKVILVSQTFEKMTLIARHRLVNNLVESERHSGMHALSLILKSPQEWNNQPEIAKSPTCKDGYKHG